MKKLSLQLRLTLLTAVLLALTGLMVYLFVSNSALMRMDEIETSVISIQLNGSDEITNLDFSMLLPELQDTIQTAKDSFRLQCLFVTCVIILIGSSVTWVVSGIVLRPLRSLADSIENITENNLSDPLPIPDSRDELSDLTVSFNKTLARLDLSFRSQKQFTANAAHELRTPLAVIQTDLDVLEKKDHVTVEEYHAVFSRTRIQISRLSSLINNLLELLSIHNVPLDSDVELFSLAEEVLIDLESPAAAKQMITECKGSPSTIRGNDVLIYRAVYNLTENAIKYCPPGSHICLSVRESSIDVIDDGPGIPEDSADRIFEPFYRVDKARSRVMGGAGLGLALVKSIAEVHGGTVSVLKTSPEGTTMRLQFHQR